MVIIMSPNATDLEIQEIADRIDELGQKVNRPSSESRTIFEIISLDTYLDPRTFELMDGVTKVVRDNEPFKLASRTHKPESTVVEIGNVSFGGDQVPVIAGPCSIENHGQVSRIAEIVANAGGTILRGGAFKPRTNPYSFQGLGEEGLQLLREAADAYGLLTISEVMDASQIMLVSQYVDILQLGARNMHNFAFLRELGFSEKPILLKRGLSATIEEWLLAAEYILAGGNEQIILCERGIRTFETYTRYTMDISAIPVIHKLSHLPIIADPSHGTGRRDMVAPMARAALASGADGLMVEVHNNPNQAMCDGAQSLSPEQFTMLMAELTQMAPVVGRTV